MVECLLSWFHFLHYESACFFDIQSFGKNKFYFITVNNQYSSLNLPLRVCYFCAFFFAWFVVFCEKSILEK